MSGFRSRTNVRLLPGPGFKGSAAGRAQAAEVFFSVGVSGCGFPSRFLTGEQSGAVDDVKASVWVFQNPGGRLDEVPAVLVLGDLQYAPVAAHRVVP